MGLGRPWRTASASGVSPSRSGLDRVEGELECRAAIRPVPSSRQAAKCIAVRPYTSASDGSPSASRSSRWAMTR